MVRLSWRRWPRFGLAVGTAGLAAGAIAAVPALAGPPAASAAAVRPAVGAGTSQDAFSAPSRFWGGTDSNYMSIEGPAPYKMPVIGGSYGGYIGMVGNWANWQGCHGAIVYSKSDASAARANFSAHHLGIGVGTYWFMGGPGVDPHFNGRDAEATAWGADQARDALADLRKMSPKANYRVVFMDVELPGKAPRYTPARDNGWNSVYTSPCSGRVKTKGIAAQVDRAEFNGFADYLTAHSKYKAGVYSAPSIWASIFGTGRYSTLSNTYEWTYTGDTASLTHHPSGWCLSGTATCAHFFGGMTERSKYALMWQWSGGGGTYNGYGDFDQIDGSRTP